MRWAVGALALSVVAACGNDAEVEFAAAVAEAEARADANLAETVGTGCQRVGEAAAPAEDVGRPWESVALLEARFAAMATALSTYRSVDVPIYDANQNRATITDTIFRLDFARSQAALVIDLIERPIPPAPTGEDPGAELLQSYTDSIYDAWRDAYRALEIEPGGANAALIAENDRCGVLRVMVEAGERRTGLDSIEPAPPG